MAKGQKTGGRKKGTPNKATVEREALVSAAASGANPIKFFADLLSNMDAPLQLRFAAAKELAPYMHAKLASIEANINANVKHENLLDHVASLETQGVI